VRDSAELIEKGLPVYCKSVSALGGFKDNAGSVGIPISCGGVVVCPGDIIIGDDDGVAVIPLIRAEEVLAACRGTAAKEAAILEGMAEGKTLFRLLGLPKQLEVLGLRLP
jgi:4-hydroxy-4-methyl-2-oxoglutarate aldolase